MSMTIRLSVAASLLLLSLQVNAQQSGDNQPAQSQPNKAGVFQCGAGARYAAVIPPDKYLEKGDSWGGVLGKVAICGGWGFWGTPAYPFLRAPHQPKYRTNENGGGSPPPLNTLRVTKGG